MSEIIFSPVYVNYKIVNEKPRVYLFGRTDDDMQIAIVDDSFKPYFTAVLNDDNDLEEFQEKVKKIKLEEENAFVIDTELVDKKLVGKDVKAVKIYCNMPKSVPSIKKTIKEWPVIRNLYEYDLRFVRRYLIDNDITPLTKLKVDCEEIKDRLKVPVFKAKSIEKVSNDSPELKVMALDIETYNPSGKEIVPEKNPILMVGLSGNGNFKKVITWKKFDTKLKYVDFVNNEAELLFKLRDYINEFKPDILTGYYSDGFDLPYIISRAKQLGIDFEVGLDNSKPKQQKGRFGSIDIFGIAHIDILNFIRIIVGRTLKTDSYKLNNVAEELLGERKDDVDVENLANVWDNDPQRLEEFCRYNLQDAVLTYNLFFRLLPNMEEMVKLIGLSIFDLTRMSFSQLDEWYIIKMCHQYNEMILNKPGYHQTNERMTRRFKGAFVFQPSPGFYKDIAVFDFRSLYPSIIVSHNIGLSSLNCDCEECKKELVPLEGHKLWFCKNKKGFIPSILENLITRRARVKEILKKDKNNVLLQARSEALKVLANAFYGYLGFYSARWYCYDCGNSVTAYGRYYINKVIKSAEENGFKVLYGDTDSIFLSLKGKDEDEAINFVDSINTDLPGMMELDYEGFFPTGIFVSAKATEKGAKKRYAMLNRDGTLKIRGFETVRRNVSFIAKEVQENVLNIILKEQDNDKAFQYVKQVIKDLRNKTIEVDKVVIRTQLTKPIKDYGSIGPHVSAAMRMQNRGDHVGPGSIIRYVVGSGKGVIRDRVKLPDEIIDNDYDSEYYINNQIIPVVEKIFEVFGITKDELLQDKKQSKLGSFF